MKSHQFLPAYADDYFPVGRARLMPCPLPIKPVALWINQLCHYWSKFK